MSCAGLRVDAVQGSGSSPAMVRATAGCPLGKAGMWAHRRQIQHFSTESEAENEPLTEEWPNKLGDVHMGDYYTGANMPQQILGRSHRQEVTPRSPLSKI